MTLYTRIGKPILDRIAAGLGLLVLSPLLFTLAGLVAWELGRPVLFRQARPGHGARPFTLYKFRTMTNACDAEGTLLPDAERLKPFGRLLRSSSLDELPELWNVLRGEMSLVGPRPLSVKYLSRYSKEQARRHEVRPGITGLAQILGRNELVWEERFELDVWYVDNLSLALDLKILAITVGTVVSRKGVSPGGHSEVTSFGEKAGLD